MYSIDELDTVIPLDQLPQSSIGAPCPMICADEGGLHLAYYLEETNPAWVGMTNRMMGEDPDDEACALVRFASPSAHMFGPPNDEAFDGHPLAKRGLQPYAAFEIQHSSWIRRLERMNSVHQHHQPDRYAALRHYVFAFHDSTFECIAESFELQVHRGSVESVLQGSARER